MNKIEQLIQELCPEGVRYYKLEHLGYMFNGLSGKSKEDFLEGNSKFVSYLDIANNVALPRDIRSQVAVASGERQNKISRGDLLFTGSSEDLAGVGLTSEVEHEPNEPTYLNSFCFGWRPKSGIFATGFLKHLFRSQALRSEIMSCSNGVTRINISKKLLQKIFIPTPPIEVQQEIVSILDKLSELEAELEAELESRTSQFKALRRSFFQEASIISLAELGSLCEMYSGEFVKKDRQGDDFLYPVYNGGSEPTGFYSEFNSPENSIVIASRGSIGSVSFVTTPFWAGNSCFVLRNPVQELNYRFLYHFLKHSEPELYKLRAVGTIPAINLKPLMKFEIPILTTQQQERICSILDKFEQLESDTKLGLPAEIQARRKQYEYYRDKLLTFKELDAA